MSKEDGSCTGEKEHQASRGEDFRELDRQFRLCKQEKRKLEIALKRCFGEQEEEDAREVVKRQYVPYLTLRIRPAGEWLIKEKENHKLRRFLREFPVEGSVLEELLFKAGKYKNTEAQLLLLQRKKELQGFGEKNWEL